MDKRREKQFLIKVVCVIASFCLWLYMSNYDNPIDNRPLRDVKVEVKNLEVVSDYKLVMLPEQEFTVNLSLRGPRADIYKANADQFKLEVDLSAYALAKGKRKIPVELKQWPENISIVNKDSLAIEINLDEYKEKTVPVKADVNVETKQDFSKLDTIIQPANVTVSGAAKFVDTVEYVRAQQTVKGAESNVTLNLPLEPYNAADRLVDHVDINPKNVDIVVPVKKRKEVGINLVEKGTLNSNLVIKKREIEPDKVVIAGDAKVVNDTDKLDTEPVDLSKIASTGTVTVKLVPKNVDLMNSNGTVNIKYTVEKIVTRNITKDISFPNLGTDLAYTSDIKQITLAIKGEESRVNALSPDEIQCIADLKDLTEGERQLTINVKVPDDVKIASTYQDKVKVTITKKTVPTTTTQ